MKAICVDDEELILQMTVAMCSELPEIDDAKGFSKAVKALDYLKNNRADLALLDIDMPEMTGLVLAAKMKEIQPDIAIIFVTGYSEYAVDAFQLHAAGYLLKPIGKDKLASEVSYALSDKKDHGQAHIRMHTFGNFDMYVDGSAVSFKRAKAKEVLAYLVDRQGATTTRAEVFAALWEDGMYDRAMQKQFDVIVRSLRDTLDEYKVSEVLEMSRGALRVVPETFDCDLYRFLEGDADAVNSYMGEYMSAYPWAEFTEGYISGMDM